MKEAKKLPRSFQKALWSYDIKKIDVRKDKKEVITQILNYGDWQDIKTIFKLYSEEEIKKVIRNPRRGVWFEKVLNFWCSMLNISLKKEIYQNAIFRINPET